MRIETLSCHIQKENATQASKNAEDVRKGARHSSATTETVIDTFSITTHTSLRQADTVTTQ